MKPHHNILRRFGVIAVLAILVVPVGFVVIAPGLRNTYWVDLSSGATRNGLTLWGVTLSSGNETPPIFETTHEPNWKFAHASGPGVKVCGMHGHVSGTYRDLRRALKDAEVPPDAWSAVFEQVHALVLADHFFYITWDGPDDALYIVALIDGTDQKVLWPLSIE